MMAWYDCVATKRQGIVLSARKLRMSHCLANRCLAEGKLSIIPDDISVLRGTEPRVRIQPDARLHGTDCF